MVNIASSGKITNNGMNNAWKKVYGDAAGVTISKFSIGVGTTTPAAADTDAEKPFSLSGTTVDLCEATTGWSATTDGSLTLNTTAQQYVEGSGALNLIKSGTANASVTFSKDTTSVDFTSKRIQFMFYVADTTKLAATGVSIRFGSDASNYYQKDFATSTLSNGWNYLYFTSATATSTTGTPSLTAMDYTALVVNYLAASTTVAAPDMRMDNIILSNQLTDDMNSFVTGFPTYDTTTRQVTVRGFLSSLQANGVPLREVGEFDSTGVTMQSHDVYDAISTKTNLIEVAYIIVHQLDNA